MKINNLGSLLALASLSALSQLSAQITVVPSTEAFEGTYLADSAGNFLPAGNEVRLGYFNDGFDYFANAGSVATLLENFTEFASTNIQVGFPDLFPSGGGAILESNLHNSNTGFSGKSIHLMIFKTLDDGPVVDLSSVQEYGVFGSSNEAWIFPGSGDSKSIFTGQIDQFIAGGKIENAGYLGEHPNPYSIITLTAIPEPKAIAAATGIFAFGLLIFLRRRRSA